MARSQSRIQVDGLREAVRNMKALGEDMTPIKDANFQAAAMLIKEAMPLVPELTGALKASLRPSKAANYAEARGGNARVPYANPIHWGWYRDKKTGIIRDIKPQPFFQKALGYSFQEIMANYDRNMQKAIHKHKLD